MELNKQQLEKYSSAVTLSDMEIFIYPELMFSLVLANIMSPRIWAWKDHPFFRKMDKMTKYRKVLRLKQFIIDQYDFNLDLETWGLTTQEREIARFKDTIDPQTLSQSNALFGYEGDKYYFDIDIRRHFGLDKYTENVIPYWKTETVEAMDAFRYKDGYAQGAGECVSLAALYAAALYIICDIPLEDIYLLATPLHSQNFVDMKDGILTNNRRIVTKAMWFNGTELTDKAQRALRHERVTIVSHCSGYIHTVYPKATIDPKRYAHFQQQLKAFLRTKIDMEIIVNFLRHHHELQKCFQIVQEHHGRVRFLPLEVAYQYEHSGPYKLNSQTRDKLLEEVDEYKWSPVPLEERVLLKKLEEFFSNNTVDFEDRAGCEELLSKFDCQNANAPEILRKLIDFVYVEPRLPNCDAFIPAHGVHLEPGWDRDQVIEHVDSLREKESVADLAFYAYRDLARTEWEPFVKAAIERNPVCVDAMHERDIADVVKILDGMSNESIYDENRIAQPDEVWNYNRGDGVERVFLLSTVLKSRYPDETVKIQVEKTKASCVSTHVSVCWESNKGLCRTLTI